MCKLCNNIKSMALLFETIKEHYLFVICISIEKDTFAAMPH